MSTITSTEISMPKLSDSMEEGTILSWLVAPGAEVALGQDLLEVETDKANMTVQAEAAGVLEILAGEGESVAVGTIIARLGDGTPSLSPGSEAHALEDVPSATDGVSLADAAPEVAAVPPRTRLSTPLARRLAGAHGVDIGSIAPGSGVGGRVVKADVVGAAGIAPPPVVPADPPAGPAASEPAAPVAAPVETAKGGSRSVELSQLQKVIARRMAEAKATIPHFQVQTEVQMDAAIALRTELKRIAGENPAPSFNDMVVRAAALALRDHPTVNGSYRDGAFELHERINVGIAVAGEAALVVPTIFDADRKSLGELGREARRAAERVRAGTITPPELAGGTFTISNLGMFGMTAIYPVINPPQAAILGVGRTRPILRRGNAGEIEDASLMTITLSCDHRILYGAEAAEFLDAIRRLLESPLAVAL